MSWLILILIGLLPMLFSAISTGFFLKFLQKKNIFDRPNTRASHKTPTPRGGGIPVIFIIIITWIFLYFSHYGFNEGNTFWIVVGGILMLAVISWIDDIKGGVSPVLRLCVQVLVVSLSIIFLNDDAIVFQGLIPVWADHLVLSLLWVWFINLFNFMDGIDGIAGTKVITIGVGVFLLSLCSDSLSPLGLHGLSIASVAIGFLLWNWQPSKIFLGDVGSIPLGYLIGWLLIYIATNGYWIEALLLPAYYFADATITLIRRLMGGNKPWIAHREHAYQVAVTHGMSHAKVSLMIGLVGMFLVGLALIVNVGEILPWVGLTLGAILVLVFIYYLQIRRIAKN